MTKDELMDLAAAFRAAKRDDCWDVHKALSDAYDAALTKARSDALEEAAEACRQSEAGYEPHAAQIAADAVLRLKETK